MEQTVRSSPALLCRNLAVGYHGRPLIRDISFDVQEGQILTLIGPNGAGKSTILKSLSRQLRTLGGEVYLHDKLLWDMTDTELSRTMAVVMTSRVHTEYMTCRDVVSMGRYPYTGRLGILSQQDQQLVEEVMTSTGIRVIADRDFSAISDGQRQRVLLASALCQETSILILDEPTSFLDLHYQRSLLRMIWYQAKKNRQAVILSLHELELARQISDIVVCVKGEKIWKTGTPAEVFQEDVIEQLFDLPAGSYNPAGESLQLGLEEMV